MKTMTTAQRCAIDSTEANILVLAGPGSGKTATTVERITRLIEDGASTPRRMVAITFTNSGARELEKRLNSISDAASLHDQEFTDFKLGYCGTLHGFALRMLKQHGAAMGYGDRIALIDEDASADLIQSKATSLGCKTPLKKLLALKSSLISNADKGWNGTRQTLEEIVIRGYYDDMREAGLVDFDLLLSELLRWTGYQSNIGFDYLFVDEVQDSAEIDWKIYDALPIANKFFVGDPDQAIYSFRGGRVDLLQEYASRLDVEVIKLEENFRSRMEICDAANALICHNGDRIAKSTISVSGVGGAVQLIPQAVNEGDEVARVIGCIERWVPAGPMNECAILARNNDLCRTFREALKASGIPVVEPPKSELPKDWALARALVELLAQPENDTLAFFLIIQMRIRGGREREDAMKDAHQIKMEAVKKGEPLHVYCFKIRVAPTIGIVAELLINWNISAETRMKVAELIRTLPPDAGLVDLALAMNKPEPEKEKGQGVTVTTYHGAKGREWDTVFLVGTEDEVIPGNRKTDTPADVEEARRLFYVGITRARKALFISCAKQRKTSWGAIVFHRPSRFIAELTT